MAKYLKKLGEPVSKLLDKGVKSFKSLADKMKEAIQMKAYAEEMSHMTKVLKSVNEHLTEKEKKVGELLNEAYAKSTKAVDDATSVVSAIKSQTSTLLVVLSESGPGSDKQKMLTACKLFAKFAKKVEDKVTNAEASLRDACIKLQEAQNDIGGIVGTLKKVHDRVIDHMQEEEAKRRKIAYGSAAVGALAGPFGLLVSYAIASGVTEGVTIPNIKAEFEKERKEVDKNIKSFERMQTQAKRLQGEIESKKAELIDIKEKLSTLGDRTGDEDMLTDEDSSEIIFHAIREGAKDLVEACKKFLKT